MLILVLSFASIFTIVAVLLLSASKKSEQSKQALGRLRSAIATREHIEQEQVLDVRKREKLSAIPALNRALARLAIGERLRTVLAQAESDWTPGTVLLLIAALWLAAFCLITLAMNVVIIAALVALIPAAAPWAYLLFKRNRRFAKFEAGLPSALDLMVSAMRAGHSVVSAVELVGRDSPDPIGKEFRLCFEEQNYGLELRDALEHLSARVPIPDLRLIITAILVQKETGGNLAEVLEKCAHLVRERFKLKREIRIKTAQGRLTGWILSLLPVTLAFLMYLSQPDVVSLLWKRPIGVKLLYIGLTMITIGTLLIRKIVRIRV